MTNDIHKAKRKPYIVMNCLKSMLRKYEMRTLEEHSSLQIDMSIFSGQ